MKNIVKKTISIGILSCTCFSSAFAESKLNISIGSDYVWRGNSQTKDSLTTTPANTNHNPAISLGIEHQSDKGFYYGAWTSNIKNQGDDIEIDLYAGYSDKTSDEKYGYDLGLITYIFPGTETNFTEAYANTSLLQDTIQVGVNVIIHADERIVNVPISEASLINDDTIAQAGDTYTHLKTNSTFGPFDFTSLIALNNAHDSYLHSQTAFAYDIPDKSGTITFAYDTISGGSATISGKTISLVWNKSFDF